MGKEQKVLVERHVAGLTAALAMTPEQSQEHAETTMLAVSKMMLVLAGKESGDFVGEAKGEAYMDALEDVPSWAVREAMRKWHRGECGPRHDYRWQPGPSVLRDLAMIEVYRVMATKRKLSDLLVAEPLLEFSDEHRAAMKAKLGTVNLRSMQ